MKIYLTRHGETTWNVENRIQGQLDSPLTEAGIAMAETLAESVQDLHFDAIYTSDLKRAVDTAAIIAKGAPLTMCPELRELDVGDWSGRKFTDIQAENSEAYRMYFNSPHRFRRDTGESLVDLSERVAAFFEKYILGSEDETVLIVSHGVTIAAIFNYMEGVTLENFWTNRVRRNAMFNIIEYSGGTFKILQKAPKNPIDTI
ncbi:histidine phosphatase family protein [Peptoniphilus equinus]|uniref:Histidine phosphatase family protein n=1 Tax=Peptoniphilus equinus TaxID=3016343 RepID=A0ABY7QUT5_9FIRM|nr:histidine phosphatase family protein [Peptoniphilus equinus]WBW50541.1 histidine phosphatase family protein [Peptoniphilus equinus]